MKMAAMGHGNVDNFYIWVFDEFGVRAVCLGVSWSIAVA
jgi:hypothetical protein